ncbi:MAG: hypothetical protein ACXIT9_14245 [Nitritalea sp.]
MKRVFIKDKLYIIRQFDQENDVEKNNEPSSVGEMQETYHVSMESPSVEEIKKALLYNRQVLLLILGVHQDGPIFLSRIFLDTHNFRWDLLTGSSEEVNRVVFHCFEFRYSLERDDIVKIWRIDKESV